MHNEYLQALTAKIEADDRIKAAWLEGSFGRGNADRYSDLDVHLLLAHDHVEAFRANTEAWLSTIKPLVLFNVLFDGMLANALTANGLRLDLVLHGGDTITLVENKACILADKAQYVHLEQSTPPVASDPNVQMLAQQTKEFWRCIALLPSVVGRDELITGLMGLTVEVNLLVDVLLAGYGIARDRGVKNLNQFLPPDIRQALEAALWMDGLSTMSLAQAHLDLAQMMRQHGPIIATKHGYVYPADLEAAVLRYVHDELALLRLDTRGNTV
jgi:hypothetical protein